MKGTTTKALQKLPMPMPIPDYQTLMLPVLRLTALGETSAPEMAEAIADEFGLTEAERKQLLPSGRQKTLHNRVHWARIYLDKAGLVETVRRGRYRASPLGHQILSQNPQRIDNKFLKQFAGFRAFISGHARTHSGQSRGENLLNDQSREADGETTPEERIEIALNELHEALKDELLAQILKNSPSDFERLIVDLLVAMGYGGTHENAARQIGGAGDGGVDGIIDEDRLGLDRVYVQAKRYAGNHSVGRQEVQGFVGSLVGLGAHKGVFVTTSGFTTKAVEFVRHLPQRVVLIDGARLTALMIEHDVGVRTDRLMRIKRVDHDYFAME